MSTRSGRRIHLSFDENTLNSESDIPKSERKTRSKLTKENSEESQAIPKPKKRNYVVYPGDDVSEVDAVDGKDKRRTTRALRKNALKERNCASPTEIEPTDTKPSTDLTKSVRTTRRTRKFPENIEEAPESDPQNEQLSKPKKDKKKKKKPEKDETVEQALSRQKVEVMTVPKKKSKKKQGRRSSSITVEDIVPEAPSTLNKSNMSVDSFHSAAGSPRNTDNEVDNVQKDEDVEKIIEVRKTRSFGKPDISSNGDNSEKQSRRRKSSIKIDIGVLEDDADKVFEVIRKSNTHNVSLLPDTKDEKINSTFDVEEKINESSRKLRRSTFDKTISPKTNNTTSDKDTYDKLKISDVTLVADKVMQLAEENANTSFNKEIKNKESEKDKRKSAINTITQITHNNKPTLNKSNKRKSIANNTYENAMEVKISEARKSMFDATYSCISAKNLSPIKQPEENINTTFDKDMVNESVKGKRKSAINAMAQINNKHTLIKSNKKKSIANETFESAIEAKPEAKNSYIDATFNSAENSSPVTNKHYKKSIIHTTFEKDHEPSSEVETEMKKNETYDLTSSPFKSAYEVSSPVRMDDDERRTSVVNTTYEKDDPHHITNNCKSSDNKNTTFEKEPTEETLDQNSKRKSSLRLSSKAESENNTTFDIDRDKKLDATFDKHSKSSIMTSDSSMITLDKSNASRISITSDESKNEENILNATPVLIESSLDESSMNTTLTKVTTPDKNDTTVAPITPLKREGTFTKHEPEVMRSPKPGVSRTPTKRMSLPSPGFTPFHVNKSSSKEKSVLMNITRSIEKRRSSLIEPSRNTKVMFCSPVNNPIVVSQMKRKVIKSNLKGSNKSFVFDESASAESRPATRKRSYTQSDAEDSRAKRKRLATDLQQSVDRLSRPRTSSASAKLAEPTTPSKKPKTPSKKSETKISRTKLPNFAALHQKGFDKMESLGQCQERRARRARQLLTPSGAADMLDRISPKDKPTGQEKPEKSKEALDKAKETGKSKEAPKPETPIKSLPSFRSLNPGYTRFGFKLNLDINPFSIPSKPKNKTVTEPKEKKPNGLARQPTLPSLTGATSVRREVAKQTVMREKSFTDRRNENRTVNRTVIKGVRTNRRFELQMKMRDI